MNQTHILVLVDGIPQNIEKFKQWLQTRQTNHPSSTTSAWNPQIRELRLLDIVVPEHTAEAWIADIKAVDGYGGHQDMSGYGGREPNRMEKMSTVMKWVNRMFGLGNTDHIKPTQEDVHQNAIPNWWIHPFVLGTLADPKAKNRKNLKDGTELL